MLDFSFKPIPKSSPIPPGVVGLIGGALPGIFGLSKDNVEIIIEYPESDEPRKSVDPNDPCYDYLVQVKIGERHAHFLEIVETLLPTIEFGKSNWAYLLPAPTGGYHILHKEKTFPRITCPTWAPLIYLDEIEFTVWGTLADRRGIWQGKEVDVWYGWNKVERWTVNRAMYGYRAVQGLDVTFEVYGHLVGRDGSIMGLVSEAARGRIAEPSDRILIYQAIARMQRRGIIYKGCLTNRFIIFGGKVRLTELNCITVIQDRDLLEKEAELWHWKELEQLFLEFDRIGPYGLYRIPLWRFWWWSSEDLKYIRPLPSPERPLGGLLLYPDFFEMYPIPHWPGYIPVEKDDEDEPVLSSLRKRKGRLPVAMLLANFVEGSSQGGNDGLDNLDSVGRFGNVTLRSRRRQVVPFHPYNLPKSNYSGRKSLTNSADTDTSTRSLEWRSS
ncbi:hypothetical protein CPB84DRAFT_1847226 [Gymnopilus junonius]|uniref:Uncharacterized protein n=1 Tax=Gymnopilus junonius TaxID=109634 RepID=A0A9P5TNS5_GYMJU|nr:hypothetical protein CPB84DRAFT_1847226 [Gymnopilus junonius]